MSNMFTVRSTFISCTHFKKVFISKEIQQTEEKILKNPSVKYFFPSYV